MMKVQEFKMKVINGVNGFIDDYFGANTKVDKFINATLKIMVKQNQHMLDDVIMLFADKDGMIDAQDILTQYAEIIGEKGIVFDIKDFVSSPVIRPLLPDKVLLIKKEDILNILD